MNTGERMKMELILASASPRRAQLLKQLGLSFRVHAADLDESGYLISSPEELAETLAREKAKAVAETELPESVILAADTIVVRDGVVLGKPNGTQEAERMLKELSGGVHSVVSGIAVICGSKILTDTVKTDVVFRTLTQKEIEAYVKTGEPLDKAGAYGIQGMGAVFVEEIKGDYYNVVGLPLCALVKMLRNFGIPVLGD